MRALPLLAAVLALSACGKGSQADNSQNAESFTPESITSNDVTAIDAVTGDDANMAADVDINFTADQMGPTGNAAGSSAATNGSAPVRSKAGPKSPEHPSEPVANTATTNSL